MVAQRGGGAHQFARAAVPGPFVFSRPCARGEPKVNDYGCALHCHVCMPAGFAKGALVCIVAGFAMRHVHFNTGDDRCIAEHC